MFYSTQTLRHHSHERRQPELTAEVLAVERRLRMLAVERGRTTPARYCAYGTLELGRRDAFLPSCAGSPPGSSAHGYYRVKYLNSLTNIRPTPLHACGPGRRREEKVVARECAPLRCVSRTDRHDACMSGALHAQPNFAPGNRRVIGEPNIKLLCGYHPTMDSVHM